jgi:hypothetical protein
LLLRAYNHAGIEFRVWLTRRYTELLVKIIDELLEKSGGIQQVSSAPATVNQLKQGALGNKYTPPSARTADPPGQSQTQQRQLAEQGFLAYKIQYERLQNGNTHLRLLPEEGQGLNLALDPSQLFLIYTLVEQALLKADWKIHLPQTYKDPVH